MLKATQSTVEEHVGAQVSRTNSDKPTPADLLKTNVNGAVLRVPLADAHGLTPNEAPRPAVTLDEQDGSVRIIGLPPLSAPPSVGASFHALQEWEGHVLDVDETNFVARLLDVTAGASHEGEEAIIPRVELSEDEDAKMRAGSVFRWVIGYERSPAGTKKRVSQIVFRDLPAITSSDLQDGEAWAQEMARSLNP